MDIEESAIEFLYAARGRALSGDAMPFYRAERDVHVTGMVHSDVEVARSAYRTEIDNVPLRGQDPGARGRAEMLARAARALGGVP